MRQRARVDRNHGEIVKALRQAGCNVLDLSRVGHGCPDLLVARRGELALVEVKDGTLPPSRRKLTKEEALFHCASSPYVRIVTSVEGALVLVGAKA